MLLDTGVGNHLVTLLRSDVNVDVDDPGAGAMAVLPLIAEEHGDGQSVDGSVEGGTQAAQTSFTRVKVSENHRPPVVRESERERAVRERGGTTALLLCRSRHLHCIAAAPLHRCTLSYPRQPPLTPLHHHHHYFPHTHRPWLGAFAGAGPFGQFHGSGGLPV